MEVNGEVVMLSGSRKSVESTYFLSYGWNNDDKNVEYCYFQTISNIVATLVATNPDAIASSAIQSILDALQDSALLAVTRDEYFTYLTPEGELYDKSSVPGYVDLV